MADMIAGPSGGILGKKDGGLRADARLAEKHPDLARQVLTFGKQPRAGHDRERWETVRWHDYRAQVGIPDREGPWRITCADSTGGTVSEKVHRWMAEAEQIPWEPGVYTILEHDERGLVMSDLPGEIAGALPFLDYVADDLWQPPEAPRYARPHVLIAGLGLGIVPAWLLRYTGVARIDVIEIDPDLIRLTTRAARSCADPGRSWADDPRLHIHHADAHDWQPSGQQGCALHGSCAALLLPARWDAAWLDIWGTISAANLPSMDLLEARYGPLCDRVWSWERPECEAMRDRGQTVEGPSCWVDETGYPHMDEPGEHL